MMLRAVLTLLLSCGIVVATSAPAHAACGDTAAQWVDPTSGSAWSGTIGSNSFTAVMVPTLSAAATVIMPNSGAGTWVYDYSFRWTASAAGVWEYRFEVGPASCSGGQVTAAGGGATDALNVVHSVSMTRTL